MTTSPSLRALVYCLGALLFLSCSDSPVSPTDTTGYLEVVSDPEKAGIVIDGETLPQKTPYIVEGLDPGEYVLEVRKIGYRDWKGTVAVSAGDTMHVHVELPRSSDDFIILE